eukprot:270607-Chlamydomonas_euryale.AAC.1
MCAVCVAESALLHRNFAKYIPRPARSHLLARHVRAFVIAEPALVVVARLLLERTEVDGAAVDARWCAGLEPVKLVTEAGQHLGQA